MATKMLWELKAPLAIAQAKQDMGLDNIFKYLRYYNMFVSRYDWEYDGKSFTHRIENILFWRGKCALVKDSILGLVVAEIDSEIKDANDNVVKCNVSAENGFKRKNLKVGQDCVILYSDNTFLPPVLYIWAIANKILEVEDIISQQNNMLRKPIMVSGEGAEFDDAVNDVLNVLSSVAWFNYNPKSKTKNNMLIDKPAEVLNLQVGNAYKAPELWDSRKHYEELICDYLGYITVKNEKRERMNTMEVNNDNTIGKAFYKSATKNRKDALKFFEGKLKLIENISQEEVIDNDSKKDLERPDSKQTR